MFSSAFIGGFVDAPKQQANNFQVADFQTVMQKKRFKGLSCITWCVETFFLVKFF